MNAKYFTFFIIVFHFFSIPLFSQNCNDTVHTGEGTFYVGVAGSSGGNCSLPVDDGDFLHCALNTIDYDGSNACGSCIEVTGPMGKVTLKVVDRCPECEQGDVDMTEPAFSQIANPIDGRINISWNFVECPFNNTIKINFKEENRFFNAIQLRDIKHAISKLEYRKLDTDPWKSISRENFNFFIESSEITYPITLRATSILGEELIFENIIQRPPSEEFDTLKQFSTPEECNSALSLVDYYEAISPKKGVIFPNPTQGLVSWEKDFRKWEIYSSKGEFLKKGNTKPVNISTLSKGIYFITIDNNSYKLIKE